MVVEVVPGVAGICGGVAASFVDDVEGTGERGVSTVGERLGLRIRGGCCTARFMVVASWFGVAG